MLQLVYQLLREWQKNSNTHRDWVINHALRSAVKRCEPQALALLGYTDATSIVASANTVTPGQAKIGASVRISTTLHNQGSHSKALMVDFAAYYIKANGPIWGSLS